MGPVESQRFLKVQEGGLNEASLSLTLPEEGVSRRGSMWPLEAGKS